MNNLKTNFGKRKITAEKKTPLVQKLFSEVSKKYDLMNDIMSFGTHRLWKKRLIEIMNINSNDKIIDVGSGTGDLTKIILKENKNVLIYSVDLNLEMLNEAKKQFNNQQQKKIKFINANAENLPFENNFFDKYVISFCLRNITYIEKALYESFRILKPGGIFYCLEFSTPSSSVINKIYSKYKNKIVPIMGEKVANNKNAYKYLEESISQFPNQKILLDKINNAGFERTSYINLFDGIVSIHIGFKI
jgi:demethylmenaquinone methyltransferase/2-methoxy-6-polyprenyl-1,4-benzoquinol methylase